MSLDSIIIKKDIHHGSAGTGVGAGAGTDGILMVLPHLVAKKQSPCSTTELIVWSSEVFDIY